MTAGGPDGDALEELVLRLRAAGCVFAEEEAALVLEQAARSQPAGRAAEVDRLATAREARAAAGAGARLGRARRRPGRGRAGRVRAAAAYGAHGRRGGGPRLGRRSPVAPGTAVVLLDLCCGSGAVAAAVAHGLRAVGRGGRRHRGRPRPGRRPLRPAEPARRARAGQRPVRRAAGRPARSRRRPHRERPLRPHRRPGADAARGARARAAALARRRARTGWRCCAGSPRRPRPGWRPAGRCWSRPANASSRPPSAALEEAGLGAGVRLDDDLGAVVVLGRPRRARSAGSGPAPRR